MLWLLGPIGETTWDDLLACLKDSDTKVRQRALHQLHELPNRGTNMPTKKLNVALADLLKNHNVAKVRNFAMASLDARDPDAFLPLFDAAKSDKDEDVRVGAISRSGEFKEQAKPAVPLLIDALKDPAEHTRRSAAMALARIGPVAKAAIPHLIELMKDKDQQVCQSAAYALSHQDKECLPGVLEFIKNSNGQARSWPLVVLRNHKYGDRERTYLDRVPG